MNMEKNKAGALAIILAVITVIVVILGLMFGLPSYSRYQHRAEANNEVLVNEIRIKQQEQLIQVEKQKAQIRVEEAKGIRDSQQLINATLTDQYLQHEAIEAQKAMAGSPNHTQIYIPVGNNGIPLVKTLE